MDFVLCTEIQILYISAISGAEDFLRADNSSSLAPYFSGAILSNTSWVEIVLLMFDYKILKKNLYDEWVDILGDKIEKQVVTESFQPCMSWIW